MKWIFYLLFGKKCEFCKKPGFRFCPNCMSKKIIQRKSQDDIPYFLNYQDIQVRKLIWKLKYKNEYSLANDISIIFGEYILSQIEDDLEMYNKKIYIVPAPTTKDKKKYRLQNHMLVVAKELNYFLIKNKINSCVCDCVDKKSKTRSVMILGKKKRVEHINKTIHLKSSAPKSGFVFVVDDVTTTGATLKRIKKLISRKGVKVQVLALAH